MKKIFAFSGTHCVGKSTLINKIKQELSSIPFDLEVLPSNSTSIKGLNEELSLSEIQLEMIRREYSSLFMPSSSRDYLTKFLKDRCILDVLAYSTLLLRHNKISKKIHEINTNALEELLPLYSKVFLLGISPEIPFVTRDKFSYQEDTRDEVDGIFQELQSSYSPLIHKVEASTLPERYLEVSQILTKE